MSTAGNTLGMPPPTASNATGRSGISPNQVGYAGSGILNTIEEGEGAMSAQPFYYESRSALFQLPSVQRSHGDEIRSFNTTQFGSRALVTLPRKNFHWGPTLFYLTLPITYRWSGPEYMLKIINNPYLTTLGGTGDVGSAAYAAGGVLRPYIDTQYNPTADGVVAGGALQTQIQAAINPITLLLNTMVVEALFARTICTEVPSCTTMLPDHFMSGGAGFAFITYIEQSMGGGGNLVFDRYSNFAAIMASCPTKQLRADLMRMAGGGIHYNDERSMELSPCKFGMVARYESNGQVAGSGNANAPNYIYAPIEHQMLVPLKTPETNFWYGWAYRKPLDSSCFANDLQYTVTWGNFYEIADTGTGFANAPFYKAYHRINAAEVVQMGLAINNAGVFGASTHANSGANLSATGWFYEYQMGTPGGGGNSPTALILPTPATVAARTSNTMNGYGRRWLASPIVWTNHYRVCQGSVYANINVSAALAADNPHPEYLTTTVTDPLLTPQVVNARLQMGPVEAADYTTGQAYSCPWNKSLGTVGPPSYPVGFSRAEYRNSSLKLTNPSLSAMNALKSSPSVVYYPFQYFFSQAYHITSQQNPWGAFTRWYTNMISNLAGNASSNNISYLFQSPAYPVSGGLDLTVDNLKIQQMIQMPANPCTSLIIGIYREKDRVYLGKNTPCSYSPVLFWQALNPLRATLYDGGNILFDYASNCSPAMYSLIDRPDVLRIPYRGGLCQVDPANMLPSPYQAGYDTLSSAVGINNKALAGNGATASTLAALSGSLYRWKTPGEVNELTSARYRPFHCTEQYESTLLEFPFVMHEPLRSEATVQSTPSFAKTLLRLEFWIPPLLKPPRGLDDMYSLTTNPGTSTHFYENVSATNRFQGTGGFAAADTTALVQNIGNSNITLMVPDCHHLATPLQPSQYSDARESSANSMSALLANMSTMPVASSSWNINNQGLMVHVTFMQNQVWQISPLRTSILSARG